MKFFNALYLRVDLYLNAKEEEWAAITVVFDNHKERSLKYIQIIEESDWLQTIRFVNRSASQRHIPVKLYNYGVCLGQAKDLGAWQVNNRGK